MTIKRRTNDPDNQHHKNSRRAIRSILLVLLLAGISIAQVAFSGTAVLKQQIQNAYGYVATINGEEGATEPTRARDTHPEEDSSTLQDQVEQITEATDVPRRTASNDSDNDDPSFCSCVDPIQTRRSKQTSHLINGSVTYDHYNLAAGTLGETHGISLTFSRTIPVSVAKRELMASKLLKGRVNPLKPRDDASAPSYESILGCSDPKMELRGTAAVVVQNFVCPNLWHALAVQLGTLQLMAAAGIPHVDYVVYKGQSLPLFINPWNTTENLLYEIVQPAFLSKEAVLSSSPGNHTKPYDLSQGPCLEKILWIETSRYRPGPLWTLSRMENHPNKCKSGRLHELMQSYQRKYLNVIDRYLRQGHDAAAGNNDDKDSFIQLCYVSRANRDGGGRYFTPSLAREFEGSLDQWLEGYNQRKNSSKSSSTSPGTSSTRKVAKLDRLLFDSTIPLLEQFQRISSCDVLFGPHGAGLSQQWFVDSSFRAKQNKPPLTILEWPEAKQSAETCQGYYGNMAAYLGHEYICFVSKITKANSLGVFTSFPTHLFLQTLENILVNI